MFYSLCSLLVCSTYSKLDVLADKLHMEVLLHINLCHFRVTWFRNVYLHLKTSVAIITVN
jgi:hypothetical protein